MTYCRVITVISLRAFLLATWLLKFHLLDLLFHLIDTSMDESVVIMSDLLGDFLQKHNVIWESPKVFHYYNLDTYWQGKQWDFLVISCDDENLVTNYKHVVSQLSMLLNGPGCNAISLISFSPGKKCFFFRGAHNGFIIAGKYYDVSWALHKHHGKSWKILRVNIMTVYCTY